LDVNNLCKDCGRYEYCNSYRLQGRGNKNPKVLVVGDYPHIDADLAGEAFVGNIPETLFDYLRKAGLDLKDFYFTYGTKCGGEKPSTSEIKKCRRYLHYEIVQLKPEFIVPLGNEALRATTGNSGITKYRGKEIEKTFETKNGSHKCTVVPTVSPAAILRMPKYKKMFVADLNKLHQLINKDIEQPPHNIVYCLSVERLSYARKQLLKAVKEGKPIGFDIETDGLEYYKVGKNIISMSFSVGNDSYAIPLYHPESIFRHKWVQVIQLFKDIIEKAKIVTQNGKYDAKWITSKVGLNMRFFFDTLLASYIIDENTPHNLAYLSQVYLNVPSYKNMVDQTNLINEPLKQVLKYNALDTHYTVRLYPILNARLEENPRLNNLFKRLLMGAFEMYKRAEIIGIWADPVLLKERYKECMKHINEIKDKIDKYVTPEFTAEYLTKHYKTKADKISRFNLNSPQQKAALLFEEPPIGLGLPISLSTASGNPSTSEESLIYLKDKTSHEVIDLIMEYQGWEQNRKMFLNPWQKKVDGNNRLHPNFKLFTVTGRTSCENPNLQQVPRDPFIRGIIGVPEGKVLIEADYSQAELRCIAHIANEQTFKRVYQTGGDIHTLTASQSTGKPIEEITKAERKTAKAVNFGYAYGAWWTTFQRTAKMKYGLDLTDEECKHHRERFFELYHDLPKWHEKYKYMAQQLGKVIAPHGRERRLPGIYSVDNHMIQAAEREAINSPVQGFASDITLSAAVDFYNKYIKGTPYGNEIEILITVHDAIFFEVDKDKFKKWIPIIKKEMEDLERLKEWYNVDFSVPLVADVEVGKHWGYVKEISLDELEEIEYEDLK